VRGWPPLGRIAVGVIVERRKAQSPWIDFTWAPVSALPGAPQAAPWTLLAQDADRATFYAGPAEIELHRSATGNYRENLAAAEGRLWVALRATGGAPPYAVFTVTADPAEGEALSAAGDDIVDTVAMPQAVRAEIEAFVAAHHVEQPFVKRERDRADPQALARKTPLRKQPG
jgi:hypothetical protein